MKIKNAEENPEALEEAMKEAERDKLRIANTSENLRKRVLAQENGKPRI